MLSPSLDTTLAVAALSSVLVWSLGATLRRAWRGHVARRRGAEAARGEARAASWLEARGFRVLGSQVAAEHPVHVDDAVVRVGIRADYLVTRDGRSYVVEVKSGSLAPRVDTPATRRQLLEYRVAFDVDGVLLVDVEAERIHEVSFPRLERGARAGAGWLRILVAALIGAGVALLLAHR